MQWCEGSTECMAPHLGKIPDFQHHFVPIWVSQVVEIFRGFFKSQGMALVWHLGLFSDKYSIQYTSLLENICPLSD